MKISLGRIGAILIKELQDIRTNTNVLFIFLIPILFAAVYQRFIPGLPEGFALGFGLMFLTVMVGMYVPSMTIAEEKEKGTMEVLMLSPATAGEVFIGKGLLTFISIMLSLAIMLLVTGNGLKHIDVILTGTVLVTISCIFLGMMVGMLAQNQMATGVIGLPVYLMLIMIPLFAVINQGVIQKIASVLPTYHYFKMLELAYTKNAGIAGMPAHLGVLAASIIITFVLLLLIYRKKGLE